MRMAIGTTAMLALSIAAAQPLAAEMQQQAGKSSEARLNEAEAAVAQLTGRTRVTSRWRKTTGSLLAIAGGSAVVYWYTRCGVAGPDADRYDPRFKASWDGEAGECALDGRPDRAAPRVWAEPDRDSRILVGGVGAFALGTLLATVWSEVDASDAVAFRPRPDGGVEIEVSKRINIW